LGSGIFLLAVYGVKDETIAVRIIDFDQPIRVVATNAAYGLIEVNNAYGDCFILDAVNCEKKNA